MNIKAVVYEKYGPPEVLEIREIEKPVPGDNEILVKVKAAVVSATDVIFRRGTPFISRSAIGFTKPRYTITGDALSGEVEAVGKDVKKFKKGDRIYGSAGPEFGAHAEYKCIPENGVITIMPSNISFGEAAAISDGSLTALPFIRDEAGIREGQKLLVNGASGAVGSFAVQLAKYYGAEVTGVCSTSSIKMVQSIGADKVIDYTKEDFTNNGRTYDVIFDAVGKSTFPQSKNALAPQGLYLSTVLSSSIIFNMLRTSKSKGKKAKIAFTGLRPPADRAKDLAFLKELIESGKLKAAIDKTWPMEKITEAHRYVEQGHKKGNVILTVG